MLKRSSVYFHMNVITFELNPSKQSSTVIRDLANGVTAKVKNANQSIRTVWWPKTNVMDFNTTNWVTTRMKKSIIHMKWILRWWKHIIAAT